MTTTATTNHDALLTAARAAWKALPADSADRVRIRALAERVKAGHTQAAADLAALVDYAPTSAATTTAPAPAPAAPEAGVDLGGVEAAAPASALPLALPTPPVALPAAVSVVAEVAKAETGGLVGAAQAAAAAAVAAGAGILGYLVAFSWPERHSLARDLVEDEAEKAFGAEAKRLVPRHNKGGVLQQALRNVIRANAPQATYGALDVTLAERGGDNLAASVARRHIDPTTKIAATDVGVKGALQVVTYVRAPGQATTPSSRLMFECDWLAAETRAEFDRLVGSVSGADLRRLVYRVLTDHAKALDAEVARFVPPSRHAELDQVAAFVRALGGRLVAWPVASTPEGAASSKASAVEDLDRRLAAAEAEVEGLLSADKGTRTRASTLDSRIADLADLAALAEAHTLVLAEDLPRITSRVAALRERVVQALAGTMAEATSAA